MIRKILIADDEASLRFLLAETLQIDGYDIIEAGNGEEALQLIIEHKPDLVVLDYMMPKMSGLQVLEALSDNTGYEKPVVIMLTAKAQLQDRQMCLSAGVDHFLTKPFSPLELLDLINKVFEKI